MSWFDATGFANLAKSALKEAQKTIDKALDIKDEEHKASNQSKGVSPTTPGADNDNFFASWGLKSSGENELMDALVDHPNEAITTSNTPADFGPHKESPRSTNRLTMSTSLWGSFTGSFFDNPRTNFGEGESDSGVQGSDENGDPVSKQPKKITLFRTASLNQDPSTSGKECVLDRKSSWDRTDLFRSLESEEGTLCDDSSELGVEEGFSRSKLVVESEDGDMGVRSRLSSCEADDERIADVDVPVHTVDHEDSCENKAEAIEDCISGEGISEVCEDGYVPLDVKRRRETSSTSSYKYNRLSVISSESDKKSSESVEVLGSASSEGGSGFTTSPESDIPLLSPEMSQSSSVLGLRLSALASSPESVEVIPDTPSSVEILGEESSGRTSRTTMSSPYVSPGDSMDPPQTLAVIAQVISEKSQQNDKENSDTEKLSPESVEVIPEEEEDEEDMSVADDSYTSASESTATATTTIMELPSIAFPGARSDTSDIIKSPHHISSKLHSTGESSSNESSLYSSTISVKAETGDLKSPHTTKSAHQNLGTLETSYTGLILTDVQLSLPLEAPILTHGSNRSGLQLVLAHTETISKGEISSEDGISINDREKDVKGEPKSPRSVNKLSAQSHGSNVPPVPVAYESSADENSLLSDSRTLVNTDSSCEGTIMESSSEDTIVPAVVDDSTSESNSKTTLQQTSSYYVKTMLADAMGEEDMRESRIEQLLPVRDQSPISSESRSDMVKVESEQTSGHTSGDELETTTSSDIEIISSPNGDSSSTQSRQSPAKLLQRTTRSKLGLAVERSESPSAEMLCKTTSGKVKGHQRELSETSSGGSEDSHYLEVEKLLKRVAEMTEIIEARETKLIELSRINVELQEHNSELKSQMEAALQSRVAESQDIHQVTEEFTQRLSSLERKFQQAIRDKESLRKQLEQAKMEAASRLSTGELETLVSERDEVIRELREEGEKLSKQQLQHSNIIKKLRSKEKECDNTIKNQKDQLDELNQEVERLKRSLTAKEEVERTQIEAVHQLTARTKRQEKELSGLRSQLEETSAKLESVKASLEVAYKELAESKKVTASKDKELKDAMLSAELSVRQKLVATLDEARQSAQEEREQLLMQVEDLHLRLRQAEEMHSGRETSIRQECSDLLRRLERAEARNEELAQSVSVATRPLLRQLESLQAASSVQQASWEKQERNLMDSLNDVQGRLSSTTEQERSSREQCMTLRSRVSALEAKLTSLNQELNHLRGELEQEQAQCSQLKNAKEKELSVGEALRIAMTDQLVDLRREVTGLEQQLSVERAATEAEKRRTNLLQEQLKEREAAVDRERAGARGSSPTGTPRSSPTLSFGRASLSESISSTVWPQFQDDAFECGSSSGRYSNVYDSLRAGNTTSLLEGLQSQLKLREGEVQQLQWEMSRRDSERAALTSELSTLTARVEEQESHLKEAEELRLQYEDVQHKYDALLQMYGEKVEETQELKLDLQDVKEMYKTQIDQLLKKEPTV